MGLRSNAQISDIAALIRRDVFSKYKFKTRYGEDLDLGIRLIKDGYRIGFLYSTRILHSHNRSAFYFLKRAYVDSKFLKDIFPDFSFPALDDLQRLFRDVAAFYFRTNRVASKLADARGTEGVNSLFDRIRAMYSIEQSQIEVQGAWTPDNDLTEFVQALTAAINGEPIQYLHRENMLLPHFMHHLGLLETYVSQSHEVVDEIMVGELAGALHKLFALHSGTHLAYLYLTLSDRGSSKQQLLAELDAKLASDI
jgi:hypothetical protein